MITCNFMVFTDDYFAHKCLMIITGPKVLGVFALFSVSQHCDSVQLREGLTEDAMIGLSGSYN